MEAKTSYRQAHEGEEFGDALREMYEIARLCSRCGTETDPDFNCSMCGRTSLVRIEITED